MSSSYRVQTDPRAKRTYHLAKFRDAVPALSDPSSTVRMTPTTGELGEQQWGLEIDGVRPFNGARERVAGIGGKQSGYVLFRVEPSTGVLTVLPVSEWYDFRPQVQHTTLTMEEAERSLEKGMHDGGRRLKKDRAAAEDAAMDGDADAAQAAELDSGDEFDDGADPRFKEHLEPNPKPSPKPSPSPNHSPSPSPIPGPNPSPNPHPHPNPDPEQEDVDENGREGLDMENEDDMFDDDDDDVFEEDDERAVAGREQAKQP